MLLDAITTDWGHVWMVTLLGFGIVLLLLMFLILVMLVFGKVMQAINAPKQAAPAPAAKPAAAPAKEAEAAAVAVALSKADDADLAAVAMALSMASGADKAAIAMALYLSRGIKQFPNPTMPMQARPTAWNAKAYNMNNAGF